jgi:hypothetical protein
LQSFVQTLPDPHSAPQVALSSHVSLHWLRPALQSRSHLALSWQVVVQFAPAAHLMLQVLSSVHVRLH